MSTVGAIPPAKSRLKRHVVPVEDKSSTPDGDMRTINRANAEMTRISRMERMRQYFAEQPRETIKIRKELGEQTAIINGYPFQIQAGEKVSVPVDVAELLRDAEII
jgi:hypothetical protein